jgi:GNAT superfamily N-acetyltransferase
MSPSIEAGMPISDSIDAGSLSLPQAAAGAVRAEVPRYTYRRLTMNELPLLNDLYNQHYAGPRPLAEAEWLYAGNPYGESLIYAAFDESGALAGMRPAIPFRLYWRGQERIAYEFADALVGHAHRGRGIFGRLVNAICEHAEKEDFTLFSIPNGNSLPIYRRSQRLQVLGGTETLARPIAWRRYLARFLGMPVPSRTGAPVSARVWRASLADGAVALEPVDRFDHDFEDAHVELATKVASFTLRRREFLQWRYFGSPVRQYRVALVKEHGRVRGYLVVRLIDEIAHLVDVFMPPDRALARSALKLAARWAERMGAIAVHFNASRGNVFHAAAARAGYCLWKPSGSLVIDRLSGDLLESRQCGPLGVRDAYFVMGDFDFF